MNKRHIGSTDGNTKVHSRSNSETSARIQNPPPIKKRSQTDRSVANSNLTGRPKQNPKGLQDNLRSQTPLGRTLKKKNAPTEPGTVRRSAPQQFKVKPNKKKSKSKRLTPVAASIILGILAYAILLPICVLSVALALPHHSTPETDDFTYQLGTGKNIYSVKVYGYERVRRGDVFYVDMDGLAEYCNMTTTGNSQKMRYVVRSTGESVEFLVGESVAYINGVSERTDANVFINDGKLYVPLSFAKRCFKGLDITLDLEKNKITISRQSDGNNGFVELSFPYKQSDTTGGIIFAELDPEIQNDIIMQNQPPAEEPEDGGTDNENNEQ